MAPTIRSCFPGAPVPVDLHPNPRPGELSYTTGGDMLCWDGKAWTRIFPKNADEGVRTAGAHADFMAPDFEKYPALKDAWEQYMLVYKLVKGND